MACNSARLDGPAIDYIRYTHGDTNEEVTKEKETEEKKKRSTVISCTLKAYNAKMDYIF